MNHAPLRIFIGWDSKEPAADSIIRRTTQPVSIVPLRLQALERIYTRQRGPTESTEFSLTRFLVPFLSGYEGTSIFMDSDMLCQVDIGDVLLYPLADPGKAVYVCQHDYIPKQATKHLGQQQTTYPRKNWSSFMIFDNAKCQALTPEYVNTASGLQLHRFEWLANDQIGGLPLEWNWLVEEYAPNPQAKILHYTNGGPWFEDTFACDQAELWLAAAALTMGATEAVLL